MNHATTPDERPNGRARGQGYDAETRRRGDAEISAPRASSSRCPRVSASGRLFFLLLCGGLAGILPAGCARQLTITQDDYVNTAMQIDRRAEDRTGEPLELNIVCVYPDDLKDERNDRLRPNSGITSAEWYKRRPVPGDKVDMEAAHDRFRLPPDQIFLLTNDRETYGKRIGASLRGARQDGKTVAKSGISFSTWALHDDDAVIYIFGRFTDKQGQILDVPPAKFHPPGAYTRDLAILIGVREAAPSFGQYIEIDTERCPRKMHGSE